MCVGGISSCVGAGESGAKGECQSEAEEGKRGEKRRQRAVRKGRRGK